MSETEPEKSEYKFIRLVFLPKNSRQCLLSCAYLCLTVQYWIQRYLALSMGVVRPPSHPLGP
jgi:hypothetical protein